MNQPLLPQRIYWLLFSILGLVYITGLFVPLMDNDSAHHANIALRMHLTGDYVNLIDYGKDYLDKPHLHFWLAAFSYKIFGVTGFAYKFPSLLFSIAGVYATFRIGLGLYNREAGKLAALVLASAFAFILANNDVRMDAILTASIAIAVWQLVEFIEHKKIINVFGAALGLALGFCTKGHIAVFLPAIAALAYILYRKEWKLFYHWKWLLLIIAFGLFISPVVYCYYLQFNLHPEKIIRGQNNIDGVKFILFNQSVERFQGDSFGSDSKHDYFFFLHSFLWAFAPWSVVAYIALYSRLKNIRRQNVEWLSIACFIVMLLVVSFSGFKLPHYLNIVFPTTAAFVAGFIIYKKNEVKWVNAFHTIQLILSIVLLLLAAVLTFWAFPIRNLWIIPIVLGLLSLYFYFITSRKLDKLQRTICISVSAMALLFFLLNANFYPQLLKYQGGNELAFSTKNKVDAHNVYAWKETYSSSYNFYTAVLRQPFTDSIYQDEKKVWLLYDVRSEEEIKLQYQLGQRYLTPDYEITKLDIKFINPRKRKSQCTQMVLAEIVKRIDSR